MSARLITELQRALPTLDTHRLRLRQLRAEDVAHLFAIFSDPEVMRYWSSEPLSEPSDALALFEEIEAGRASLHLLQWGIARRDDDELIGTTTLFAWDRRHRRAELGLALARAVWGQGLGTEALARIVEFAFTTMQLHRLEADPDPRNEPSIRILRRLGFREEGRLRERYLLAGQPQDALFMGLLRSEWEQHREPAV